MISLLEATSVLKKNFPDFIIEKSVDYNSLFVFLVSFGEPDEPSVFVSVNKETKEINDFSPMDEVDDSEEFQKLMT